MSNLIFSINYPKCEDYIYCNESAKMYCKKYNLDYFLLEEQKIGWIHHFCERFYITELLKTYDRICYVDGDVMITPHAKNIFEYFPDENKFGAFDENFSGNRNQFVNPLLYLCPWWEKNERGLYRFFNAGVMLMGKRHLFAFENYRNHPDSSALFAGCPDQTYLNYLTNYHKLPFVNIGSEFNRMPREEGIKLSREEKFKSSFVHYAGIETHEKAKIMKKDFETLFSKKLILF